MRYLATAALALAAGFAPSNAVADVASVKIGVLNDVSGVYADLSGSGGVDAARMAIEDFGGKIGAVKIELVSADHQNKPDIGSSVARQWFDQDKVDAIFDVPNSGVALAVQEVARDKGKIFVASGAATSDLTGAKCSPTGFHWTYDTYALAHGTGTAVTKAGGKTWYFLTADYNFGIALQRDTAEVVKANGGTVLGEVRVPLATADFSSFLLQAQASGAKVIGLANAGADTVNSIKQASEFGVGQGGGQSLAGLLVFLTDIHALGLKATQGLQFTEAFYWDQNDETRAWSKRFMERNKRMPSMVQAGIYSGVLHYLKAVKAANTTEGVKVAEEMRKLKVNDFMSKDVDVRADGQAVRDMYLFEVKKPEESKGVWDYYKLVRQIPASDVTRPLSESACPLVKKG